MRRILLTIILSFFFTNVVIPNVTYANLYLCEVDDSRFLNWKNKVFYLKKDKNNHEVYVIRYNNRKENIPITEKYDAIIYQNQNHRYIKWPLDNDYMVDGFWIIKEKMSGKSRISGPQGVVYTNVECKKISSGGDFASVSNPLRDGFVRLSKQNRVIVQSNLSNLGFYQSTIDGLYGSKTKASIESYAKSVGKEDHLKSERLIKELLQSLISNSKDQNTDEKTKKGLF